MLLCINLSTLGDILLGISSVFTAAFTAYVLCQQYRLQKNTFLIEKRAKQPVFNISLVTVDEDDDNKHDNEIMSIHNDGYIVKEISDITVKTIFDISEQSKHKIFWIIGYFSRSTTYQSLNGLIYQSRGVNNHAKFTNVYLDIINLYKEHRRYVGIAVYHMIKIEYTDIYGEKNICYFKNRSSIEENTYNTIIAQICNQQNPIDIDNVSFNELIGEI